MEAAEVHFCHQAPHKLAVRTPPLDTCMSMSMGCMCMFKCYIDTPFNLSPCVQAAPHPGIPVFGGFPAIL